MKKQPHFISKYSKNITRVILLVFLISATQSHLSIAQAASATQISDVMSRQKASTAANHEIKFVTPTGVAGSGVITLTFSAGFTGIGSLVDGDFDFAEGSSGTCSSATFTEKAIHSSPSSSQFTISGSSQTVTITSGGGSATITAGRCVRLRIGTNATDTTGSSGPGSNQITNGAIGSNDTIAIAGGFGDTGTLSVDIITNDQITISASVDPTITFTLIDASASDNAIGFGTLTSGAARYANAASTGSASDVSAVTMTVATNASSGYVLSYVGATLTSGSDTIAVATISGDADGTPGTPQFATGYTTSGSSTITAGYENVSNNWNFVANTTTTIVSRTTPTNTETIGGHYLANIGGATPAGAYSTTLTYIATATF
jgi:hypothetical protein